MAKYPYIQLSEDGKIYRPYVKIRMGNPLNKKQTPKIRGLIDSGSDICLAPKDIGMWLGIRFDKNDETISLEAANKIAFSSVKKTVIIITEEKQYRCPFFFVDGIPPDEPPLLGQKGFFDHFKVCFDLKNKTFEIY